MRRRRGWKEEKNPTTVAKHNDDFHEFQLDFAIIFIVQLITSRKCRKQSHISIRFISYKLFN